MTWRCRLVRIEQAAAVSQTGMAILSTHASQKSAALGTHGCCVVYKPTLCVSCVCVHMGINVNVRKAQMMREKQHEVGDGIQVYTCVTVLLATLQALNMV